MSRKANSALGIDVKLGGRFRYGDDVCVVKHNERVVYAGIFDDCPYKSKLGKYSYSDDEDDISFEYDESIQAYTSHFYNKSGKAIDILIVKVEFSC